MNLGYSACKDSLHTHGGIMLPIQAIVHFINDSDSQRSGLDMGKPTYLKVADPF